MINGIILGVCVACLIRVEKVIKEQEKEKERIFGIDEKLFNIYCQSKGLNNEE